MSPLGEENRGNSWAGQTAQMEGFILSITAEHNIRFTKAMNFLQ